MLEERFSELRRRGEGALIAYFPLDGGDSPAALASVYADAGVDVLEIGFPVTDPYLDGDTIRRAMQRARAAGWATRSYFQALADIRAAHPSLVLQVFAYQEALQAFGTSEFIEGCVQGGADALLVVGSDEPALAQIDALSHGRLTHLRFLPHRATDQDMDRLRAVARGYLFVQGIDGSTGARSDIEPTLGPLLEAARRSMPDVPLCVGFGVSSASQCRMLRQLGADGAIVGSAVVEHLRANGTRQLSSYLRSLKAALGNATATA